MTSAKTIREVRADELVACVESWLSDEGFIELLESESFTPPRREEYARLRNRILEILP